MLPRITDANRDFWTGGADSVLRLPYCPACARWAGPTQRSCGGCGGPCEPRAVSGLGTVFTFTVNQHAFNPAVPTPYVIAIVELDEQADLRIPATVVDCDPEQVRIGQRVAVRFEAHGDVFVPVFAPTEAPAAA
jgi:uncharacterized OB-fold protein